MKVKTFTGTHRFEVDRQVNDWLAKSNVTVRKTYLVDSDGRFVRALAGNADCQQIAVALAAAMTAKR
jgi:hypothetical protein